MTREVAKVAKTLGIQLYDHVIVGNDYLAAYAQRYNDAVTVIPTSVDLARFVPRVDGGSRNGGSGRPPGQFHWASTLWHEMSHVYILTLTNYRVPRWFTEGVAVHEETATTPDWGDRITPDIIAAIRDKKLLPVSEIERLCSRNSGRNQRCRRRKEYQVASGVECIPTKR